MRTVERKIDLIRKPCKLSPPPRSWRDRRRQALTTNQRKSGNKTFCPGLA